MNYKLIFNTIVVVTGLVLTGCTTPSMTYEPAPTPPPPPRVSAPPPAPAVVYSKQKLTEERTVVDEDKYINLTPKLLITSTIADLDVSDKKVTGSATGPFDAKDILEKQAVYRALTQKDGADVLVGFTFSYKISTVKERTTESTERNSIVSKRLSEKVLGKYLTVTVTGYPARYVNFRTYNLKNDSSFEINRSNAALESSPAAPVIVPSTHTSGQ